MFLISPLRNGNLAAMPYLPFFLGNYNRLINLNWRQTLVDSVCVCSEIVAMISCISIAVDVTFLLIMWLVIFVYFFCSAAADLCSIARNWLPMCCIFNLDFHCHRWICFEVLVGGFFYMLDQLSSCSQYSQNYLFSCNLYHSTSQNN